MGTGMNNRKKQEREDEERCQVCGYPQKDCICCPECGHVCPNDVGESYCPVCSPTSMRDILNRGARLQTPNPLPRTIKPSTGRL